MVLNITEYITSSYVLDVYWIIVSYECIKRRDLGNRPQKYNERARKGAKKEFVTFTMCRES